MHYTNGFLTPPDYVICANIIMILTIDLSNYIDHIIKRLRTESHVTEGKPKTSQICDNQNMCS